LINLIHELDNLRFICGEIQQIQAFSSASARALEVEDSLSISLLFENGALGSLLVSDCVSAPWAYELNTGENPDFPRFTENCYHFAGTLGSLAFPQMEQWRYADAAKSGWQQPLEKSQHSLPETNNPLRSQLEHFCRVVQGQEIPLVDGVDGTRSLAAVLGVLASAACGEAINTDSVMGGDYTKVA
jgi:predicted dehydrogenase